MPKPWRSRVLRHSAARLEDELSRFHGPADRPEGARPVRQTGPHLSFPSPKRRWHACAARAAMFYRRGKEGGRPEQARGTEAEAPPSIWRPQRLATRDAGRNGPGLLRLRAEAVVSTRPSGRDAAGKGRQPEAVVPSHGSSEPGIEPAELPQRKVPVYLEQKSGEIFLNHIANFRLTPIQFE